MAHDILNHSIELRKAVISVLNPGHTFWRGAGVNSYYAVGIRRPVLQRRVGRWSVRFCWPFPSWATPSSTCSHGHMHMDESRGPGGGGGAGEQRFKAAGLDSVLPASGPPDRDADSPWAHGASIEALVHLTPTKAHRLTAEGREELVDPRELSGGDVGAGPAGRHIPADGDDLSANAQQPGEHHGRIAAGGQGSGR